MKTAYIALGANLGDAAATVQAAFATLAAQPDLHRLRASSLYRTAPVDCNPQPDYINAVVAVDTELDAATLLNRLLNLENEFGRVRQGRNSPRTLDLDLLLLGDECHATPSLTLPHPRLHLRAFVLVPLAELAPNLSLPGRGSVAAWLPAVALQAIEKL